MSGLPLCIFAKSSHSDIKQNEIRIVQASLLGSILANLLLILGMAFLLGGLRFREQVCQALYRRILLRLG